MASLNPKLDSFLSKRFSVEELANIKTSESAILDSSGTLRYVVLTSRNLYLIDNPPKNIKLVVSYRDIISVKLGHNYVAFLQGADRENSQHVKVEILNSGNITIAETAKSKKSNFIELNLYIRSKTSPFASMLRLACARYVIKRARLKQLKDSENNFTSKPENVLFLFQQLRLDLLDSEDEIDNLYLYLRELDISSQRSYQVKKLFWKDLSLADFLLAQLRKYCQASSLNLDNVLSSGGRCDELELSSIIFEVLAECIGETEQLRDRNNFLHENEFHYVRQLLNLCISEPLMPESYQRPSKTRSVAHAFDEYCRSSEETVDESESPELDLLMSYCSNTLARQSLLFELMITAVEMKWVNPGSRFNLNWLIGQMAKHNQFNEYLRCLLWLAMVILDLTVTEVTTPMQSLWLFQIFSMLRTLVESDLIMKQFVQNEFQEEFKYYFQPEVVKKRLDQSLPLTAKILDKISILRKDVIGSS